MTEETKDRIQLWSGIVIVTLGILSMGFAQAYRFGAWPFEHPHTTQP